MKLFDLSHKIDEKMPVYPGDNHVQLYQEKTFGKDQYNNHFLGTGMHIGTHIDGPMHMLDVVNYIADFSLDKFCGEGCIIKTSDKIIGIKEEYIDIIKGKNIVLLHTGMDCCYGMEKYYMEHPILDLSFCRMLVESKIKMVGMDCPSPDRFPFEIHKYLLSNNILILENLTGLNQIIGNENFEVFAFPLKIKADSCMVRAVARVY